LRCGHEIAAVVHNRIVRIQGEETKWCFLPSTVRKFASSRPASERVSDAESHAYLASLKGDAVVVCAYGQLLAKNILNLTHSGASIFMRPLPKTAVRHRSPRIIDAKPRTGYD
jgi:methionyl-tRNA formyltransferase